MNKPKPTQKEPINGRNCKILDLKYLPSFGLRFLDLALILDLKYSSRAVLY